MKEKFARRAIWQERWEIGAFLPNYLKVPPARDNDKTLAIPLRSVRSRQIPVSAKLLGG